MIRNNALQALGRRTAMLALAVIAATLMGCGSDSDSKTRTADKEGFPAGTLTAFDALNANPSEFLPSQTLKDWHIALDKVGLRTTGSPAHEAYIDTIYQRLQKAGVKDLHFEETSINRWTANTWGLEVATDASAYESVGSVYIPYSGTTAADGVSAEIEYLTPQTLTAIANGTADLPTLAATFYGKIVLVDLPVPSLTAAFYLDQAISVYDPHNTLHHDDPYRRAWVGNEVVAQLLDQLKGIGAKGMVVINNDVATTDLAQLYAPYDGVIHGLPSLFVNRTVGARLRSEAGANNTVRLKLDASIETVKTRNVIGIIPGATDEYVLLNSHTDGTNGIEDNGPNVIVDIAQYLTRLPKSSLNRSIMIMLSSGHFYGGVGINAFLDQHQEDGVLKKVAAALTVEHMGVKEWNFDSNGQLVATGNNEPGALFMPEIPALISLSQEWAVHADATPTFIMPPLKPDAAGTPNDAVWPGEGQYFWGVGGIPTINYITGPSSLLNWGLSTVDFVDFDLLHRETVAFTQMVLDLTRVPRSDLPGRFDTSKQEPPPTSGPGGSDYVYDGMRVHAGGSGDDAWYTFEPMDTATETVPASAPLVVMMHGYYEYAGYDSLYEFIRHTVRKGNVVIYPRWQTSLTSACPGPLAISGCVTSAKNGITAAISYLQADSQHVQPELNKTSYFGFSFGGILTANLLNHWSTLGLPEPKAVFLDDPHDGGNAGMGEPSLEADLSGIPATTLFQCHAGAQGIISQEGRSMSGCNALFPRLTSIPEAKKDLVMTYTDDHDSPALSSAHGVCTSPKGKIDAYDYNFCWKVFDGLRDCALKGESCEYAVGDTPQHHANGRWLDGTVIRELVIQKSGPLIP